MLLKGHFLMEKRDTKLSQLEAGINDHQDWNIVELESRRHLRRRINELIRLTTSSTLTTSDLRHHLHFCKTLFGNHFTLHLVRALQQEDEDERQAVVWLLTVLNDKETLAPLQQMAQNEQLSRPVRLSASLALAGMGATRELTDSKPRRHLYAIR
jgi:HEAT repeat protein